MGLGLSARRVDVSPIAEDPGGDPGGRAGRRTAKPAPDPDPGIADNTARVQTVTSEANPRYHKLISEFGKRTGVPVIMNTSFNLKGEPIVCAPKDAVRTFYSSGLDFLVLGNYILAKDPAWKPGKTVEYVPAKAGTNGTVTAAAAR